ncbi:hypothetical protein L1049_009845 [Liquidambar formosana]|uniref:Ankyrin repeat protein n=1 Tax=Liquidambar formosana TaxID=63359 RepID=A0AAP0R3V4_LIQFO
MSIREDIYVDRLMATTSLSHQEHEGNDTPLEPFDLFALENNNYEIENWEDPRTTTTRSTASSEWNDADLSDFRPLYRAALNGDWESACAFFECDPDAKTAMISNCAMTALHVAANVGRSQFVEKLAGTNACRSTFNARWQRHDGPPLCCHEWNHRGGQGVGGKKPCFDTN